MEPIFDPADLRCAFGRFATGVTVVTMRTDDGGRVGITANSFASASLEPPLVSWNYRLASPHAQLLRDGRHFAVHVLAADQVEISRRMARPADDKFAGLALEEGLGGVPCIAGSLAVFECSVWKTVDAGDHLLVLGRVLRYRHAAGEPLMFVNGGYRVDRLPQQLGAGA